MFDHTGKKRREFATAHLVAGPELGLSTQKTRGQEKNCATALSTGQDAQQDASFGLSETGNASWKDAAT
jgi:hypothetical protein